MTVLCPTAEDMTAFLRAAFEGETRPDITYAGRGHVKIEYPCGPEALRPGGFISGPTQMMMADTLGLLGVFSHTGITQAAFTTSLSIDFLRPAKGEKLIGEGTVARFGRTLSVINVTLRGSAMDKPCAQAVVTYAAGSGSK